MDTKRLGCLMPVGFRLERQPHEALPSDVIFHFWFAVQRGGHTRGTAILKVRLKE